MCILFYSKREAGLLKMIERTARITFERIGTPQTDDLIGAAAKSAKQMLEEVNPQVREFAKFDVCCFVCVSKAPSKGDSPFRSCGQRAD